MEALLAFGAALLALRLGGALAAGGVRGAGLSSPLGVPRSSATRSRPARWPGALQPGWGEPAFRVYYLFGGLLTAALLGLGSALLYGRRWTLYPGLLYVGLAIGVAIAAPIHGDISGTSIPEAQEHLGFLPARLVAILGNSIGTIAVIGVAIATIRRRPLGNVLIITGVAVAALGSAFAGLGAAESAVFVAIAALLLYGGFTARSGAAS